MAGDARTSRGSDTGRARDACRTVRRVRRNILGLLRLHPAILERIEKLEPGGVGAEVTERWLRPISKLPHDEQLAAVVERLPMTEPEEVA